MDEEQKERILLALMIIIFGYSFYSSLYDEFIFGASISNESVFEVNLTSSVTYEFLIDGGPLGGPVSVDVKINKGSYVPFEEES